MNEQAWKSVVKNPLSHPHFDTYTTECLQGGISQKFINDSWPLIIKGLQDQAEIKARSDYHTTSQYLQELGLLIEANRSQLMLPPNLDDKEVALWSGGIKVSQHVRRKGYETLESTLFGGILDRMTSPTYKIWLGSNEWGPQGKLWNIISAHFVIEVAKVRPTMHVFMRTHDLESVFYREERVNWRAAKGKNITQPDGLTYHVLIGLEVWNKDEHEKVFNTEEKATKYLITFLSQVSKLLPEQVIGKEDNGPINYRFRSELWLDFKRAVDGSFKGDQGKDELAALLKAPSEEDLQAYAEWEKTYAPDPKFAANLSGVMEELLKHPRFKR